MSFRKHGRKYGARAGNETGKRPAVTGKGKRPRFPGPRPQAFLRSLSSASARMAAPSESLRRSFT